MGLLRRVNTVGFVLAPRERALVRTEISEGSLLATNSALHLIGQEQARFEWWQINHVTFNSEQMSLLVTLETGLREFVLLQSSLLPEVMRERVTSTILISVPFSNPGSVTAMISLRRRPGLEGEESFVQIDWQSAPTPLARSEAEKRGRELTEASLFSSSLSLR